MAISFPVFSESPARDTGQLKEAKNYFEKALSYKKHEYKNSIDSKAKSALAQLKKK